MKWFRRFMVVFVPAVSVALAVSMGAGMALRGTILAVQLGLAGDVDATLYNVIANDGIDHTADLQALINMVPDQATIVLPPGTVKAGIGATLSWDNPSHVRVSLRGARPPAWDASTSGTLLAGNVAGPMLQRNATGSSFGGEIRDLTIFNSNAVGSCLQLDGCMGVTIRDVVFTGGGNFQLVVGSLAPYTNNGVLITHCLFNGKLSSYPNTVGCATRGGSVAVRDCWARQCFVGFQGANSTQWDQIHAEVCTTGLLVGKDPAGNNAGNTGQTIAQFESCLTGVDVKNGSGIFLLSILGHAGQSNTGLLVEQANRADFHVGITGQFGLNAGNVTCGGRMRYTMCHADNNGGTVWTWNGSSGGLIELDLCDGIPAPPP